MNKFNTCLVVLNYNDFKSTIILIQQIKDYVLLDHIIVVDNCSTDCSFEKIKQRFCNYKKIDVIKSDKNGGYSYGNNYGCFYAINKYNPDIIVIANPDISFKEKSLEVMLYTFNRNENIAMVSCLMNCKSGINLPSAWKLPVYKDCVLENLIILRKLAGNRTRYKKEELTNRLNKVEVIAGSFFSIKSKAFCSVGGFDESTFLYYEENMLAYKLKKKNFVNYLITSVKYDHMHSVSIDKTVSSLKKKLDLSYNSRYKYITKYLKCNNFQKILFKVTYYIGRTDYLLAKKLMS